MPVIDKPSFQEQYHHLMDNKDNLRFVHSQAGFLSLVFAVFACAAPLVNDSRLTTDDRIDEGGMGMIYYERLVCNDGRTLSVDLTTNVVPWCCNTLAILERKLHMCNVLFYCRHFYAL
jgi:hypothetical protein